MSSAARSASRAALLQVGHEAMSGRLTVLFLLQGDLLELLGEPRQDRLETAHQTLEEVDPLAEGEVDVGLDRVLVGQVDHADLGVLLADPVDAADPLLDLHRVPGQVVIDQQPAELEVQALGGRVGADEELDGAAP